MKRIKTIYGSARVSDSCDEKTIQALNKMSELAYNMDFKIEEEMQKCKDDPVYFYENYFLIDGEKPPKLHDVAKRLRQEVYMISVQEYMDSWRNHGLILINPMDDYKIIRKYD